MESYISVYLFRNRTCCIPGIGLLSIEESPAHFSGAEEVIKPGERNIIFHPGESVQSDLVRYVSTLNNISDTEVEKSFIQFKRKIESLQIGEQVDIPSAGSFFIDEASQLKFSAHKLERYLLPDVKAITVSKSSEHTILVGDKESNPAEMNAYFASKNKKNIQAWLIIGIFLLSAVLAYLTWYFTHGGTIGNNKKIEVGVETSASYIQQP